MIKIKIQAQISLKRLSLSKLLLLLLIFGIPGIKAAQAKLSWYSSIAYSCADRTAIAYDRLMGLTIFDSDWVATCKKTKGTYAPFDYLPDYCDQKRHHEYPGDGTNAVYGYWKFPRAQCGNEFVVVEDYCSAEGIRNIKAKLSGLSKKSPKAVWWCENSDNKFSEIKLSVSKLGDFTPEECKIEGNDVYGYFDLDDKGCVNKFGPIKKGSCDLYFNRKYTANFETVKFDEKNAYFLCKTTKANIPTHGNLLPSKCTEDSADQSSYIGNWLLPEESCGYNAKLGQWMGNIQDKLANVKIRNAKIPGSHDSGTSTVVEGSRIVEPDKPEHTSQKEYWTGTTYRLSKTQGQTITQQLNMGARYLDFRICYDKKTEAFMLCHALAGESVISALQAINAFLNANKKEVLIIDIKFFFNMTAALHLNLAAKFQTWLEGLLVSRADFEDPSGGTDATFAELWDKNQRVFVLWGTDKYGEGAKGIYDDSLIWERSKTIVDKWANTDDENTLLNKMDEYVTRPSSKLGKKFYLIDAVLTPPSDWWLIYYATARKSIEQLADSINPKVKDRISKQYWQTPSMKKNINIIMVDYFVKANFAEIMIDGNN